MKLSRFLSIVDDNSTLCIEASASDRSLNCLKKDLIARNVAIDYMYVENVFVHFDDEDNEEWYRMQVDEIIYNDGITDLDRKIAQERR